MELNITEAGNNGDVNKTADAKNEADSQDAESDNIADADMETNAEINTDNLSALSREELETKIIRQAKLIKDLTNPPPND